MRKTLLLASILLSGCAKNTNELQAQYISPMQYSSYSCSQIEQEMMSVSRRVSDVAAQVNKTASDDNAQMAVGLILFWPTLFFLDGDTPQAQEYTRLQGEFNALESAAIKKNCSLQVARPSVVTQTTTTTTTRKNSVND